MLSRTKKRFALLALAASAIVLTGCGSSLTLSPQRPNQTNNASRVISSTTTTGGGGGYGANFSLTYYAGITSASVLQNVSFARSTTTASQIKITAPNLGSGTSICVITGAVYTNCSAGTFFQDLGEERCNPIQNGSGVFNMARSDFNFVTVVLYSDLAQFKAWWNQEVADSQFPTLAQGQPDGNYDSCGF